MRTVWSTLKRHTTEGINDIYLIDEEGRFLFSGSMPSSDSSPSGKRVNEPGIAGMSDKPVEYTNFRGLPVVGLAVDIPTTAWRVVTETSKASAYAGIMRLGKITAALVVVLLLAMSMLAYYLGRTIVRPLKTLGREAHRIAAGDLDVEIPLESKLEDEQILISSEESLIERLEKLSFPSAISSFPALTAKLHLALPLPTLDDTVDDLGRLLREIRRIYRLDDIQMELVNLKELRGFLENSH